MAVADILAAARQRIRSVAEAPPRYSADLPRFGVPGGGFAASVDPLLASLSREVPDYEGILTARPDVARAYGTLDARKRAKYVKFGYDYDKSGDLEQGEYARAWYETYGRAEGYSLGTRVERPGWLDAAMSGIKGLWK